jgi:hypothetical protein
VVSGAGPKTVLIRAVGPTLADFGVSGILQRPQIRLMAGQTEIATNLGWESSPQREAIAAAAQQVGAFPLSAGAADSALLLTLQPGAYTIQVSGHNGGTGVALVEVYEVGAP